MVLYYARDAIDVHQAIESDARDRTADASPSLLAAVTSPMLRT